MAVGEAMLELTANGPECWRLGVGGDSYNSAVYLARLGVETGYLTAIGSDPLSERIRAAVQEAGIGTGLILRHPARGPGLYLIETPPGADRRFHYWREASAARALFACAGIDEALAAVAATCRLLYLSGITLSLFDGAGRARLRALAADVRAAGGTVAFDPNYRPRGWADPDMARQAFAAIAPVVDIVFPTFDDEEKLFGHAEPADAVAWWRDHGVGEVALKLGADGARLDGPETLDVPVPEPLVPLDATGAGDSFNAAYLAARIAGHGPAAAAAAGHRLAAVVVRHRGAIVPPAAMPAGLPKAA